jgi:hypothetical protein
MNKAAESRELATKFKQAMKVAGNCAIEIRTPIGNPAGQRLHKSLTLAGVKTELIDVVATPNSGILIEACQDCAQLGLSIQSAFTGVGVEAHLLVQNTTRENIVIIHLNAAEEPPAAPKK